ncbi:hypothetical protein ACQ4PT_050797 [Festuca glaucescens]
MATCKRPAAVDRPGATTCRKRRRVVGTTADYDTESRLGEGMYGVVVKARHRATGQAVAIKSLCNPFNEHEPADARELLREARFLEGCGGHPNIVGFRGVVRDYVTGAFSRRLGGCMAATSSTATSSRQTLSSSGKKKEESSRSATSGGERLFQADGPVSQLRRIFEVVGAPDDATWPGFTSREFAPEVQQVLTGQRSTLREIFPEEKLSKEGFDVLSGLLTCNPDKRFTAAAALKLPWFASVAANAQPLLLPAAATTAVSIKEEEVEIAPSTLRRKRVTAKKSLPVKKTQLIAPPAT